MKKDIKKIKIRNKNKIKLNLNKQEILKIIQNIMANI